MHNWTKSPIIICHVLSLSLSLSLSHEEAKVHTLSGIHTRNLSVRDVTQFSWPVGSATRVFDEQ